jgi:hypothetical protein
VDAAKRIWRDGEVSNQFEGFAAAREVIAERDAEIARLKASVERHKLGEASAGNDIVLDDAEFRRQLAVKDARIAELTLALRDVWWHESSVPLRDHISRALRGKESDPPIISGLAGSADGGK